MIEILLDSQSVVALDDEIIRRLMAVGEDPSTFNRIEWPTGLSRWAHAKFLVHSSVFPSFTNVFVTLKIGASLSGDQESHAVEFEDMYVLDSRAVLARDGGAVYAIELADRRYLYKFRPASRVGFNITQSDKSELYTDSTGFGTPFDVFNAEQELAGDLGASLNLFDFTPLSTITTEAEWIRDRIAKCARATEAMDAIAAVAGYVWVAYPSSDYQGANGKYYRPVRIADGDIAAKNTLLALRDTYISGGFHSLADGGVSDMPDTGGIGSTIVNEVPSTLRIAFPLAAEGGAGYTFEDQPASGLNPVTDRYHEETRSVSTHPVSTSGNGQVHCIHGSSWAIQGSDGTIVNQTDIDFLADELSGRFWDRFLCGAGDTRFLYFQQIDPFAGCQRIVWSLSPGMVQTRVVGRYDDPLFGFNYDKPLTAHDLHSIGPVRAIPRADHGVTLDAILTSATRTFESYVTEVFGTENADYSAQAIENPAISVTQKTPQRADMVMQVDYQPAAVGDGCYIAFFEDEQGSEQTLLIMLTETITTFNCNDAGLSIEEKIRTQDRLRSLHGV